MFDILIIKLNVFDILSIIFFCFLVIIFFYKKRCNHKWSKWRQTGIAHTGFGDTKFERKCVLCNKKQEKIF